MYEVSEAFHKQYADMYDNFVRIFFKDGSVRTGLFNDEFYEDSSIHVSRKAILAAIVSLVLGVLAEGLGTQWNMTGIGCMVSVAVMGAFISTSTTRRSNQIPIYLIDDKLIIRLGGSIIWISFRQQGELICFRQLMTLTLLTRPTWKLLGY